MYDLIIVGSGPAGLTAAIYARRAEKSVLVIEKETFGGEITHSPKVENYPGFAELSGNELAEKLLEQAMSLGAEIEMDTITGVEGQGPFTVRGENADYEGKTLIIASGSKHRRLGVPGEEELTGSGVSYCAVCDGPFYKGRSVAIVGGGNSALQQAVMMSEYCEKVTICQNLDFLTGEKKLQDILAARDNVEIILGVTVDHLEGESELSAVVLNQEATGEKITLKPDGLFVAVGQAPENEPFQSVCDLDPWGYIVSDETCTTKTPGVYAAGDCRTKSVRQIVTATGDGAVSALAACRFLEQ